MNEPRVQALIPAAGRSVRFGGATPKQYCRLLGKPIMSHSIEAVQNHPLVRGVTVAVAPDDRFYDDLIRPSFPQVCTVAGGESRAQTVINGLRFVLDQYPDCDWILVHDAARPCLSAASLSDLLEKGLGSPNGAILAVPVSDTLKQADDNGFIQRTVDRSRIWAAQTPQLFPIRDLAANLEAALAAGLNPTDEASAMEITGKRPLLVKGVSTNIKITGVNDLSLAEYVMQKQTSRK